MIVALIKRQSAFFFCILNEIIVWYISGQNYEAKLSGFELAKLGPSQGNSHVSTRVMGTFGYAAPEYLATGA